MQGVPTQLSELPAYLSYLLLNPGLNPKIALLVYAWVALFLILVLIVGIVLLMRTGKGRPARQQKTVSPDRGRTRLATAVAAVLVLTAVVAAAGYTTSDPSLCKGCHWPAARHARASGTDPHAKLACVSCHEGGGVVGRYLTGVPARLMHLASAQTSATYTGEYGRVTAAACSSCHERALRGVVTDSARALKMSHREVLSASATCIDCHALEGGTVGTHNAGMTPCLRCHDTKHASASCTTCHDEKAAVAARARTTSFSSVRVTEVKCDGCHDMAKQCDSCHGLRLPHSAEFKAYAHARAGAVDFWFNGGKTCGRCHTASKRPCQKCHEQTLGKGHGTSAWLARTHQTATAQGCDTCHHRFAYTATRDFCKDLCHTPAAIAASPR